MSACCIGVWINVQKFEAHSHLRFYDTDHGEHLYFPASCVSVPRTRARTSSGRRAQTNRVDQTLWRACRCQVPGGITSHSDLERDSRSNRARNRQPPKLFSLTGSSSWAKNLLCAKCA